MSAYGFTDGKNKAGVISESDLNTAIAPFNTHINNNTIHVPASDKAAWDAKVGLNANNKIDTALISAGDITIATIAKADINNGETVNVEIAYARAFVVISSGNLSASGYYDKSLGKLYGTQALAKIIGQYSARADWVSAGELGGEFNKEPSSSDTSMSYEVTTDGITFENTSSSNGCDVTVYIIQLA